MSRIDLSLPSSVAARIRISNRNVAFSQTRH
jgi:hypothetical protein